MRKQRNQKKGIKAEERVICARILKGRSLEKQTQELKVYLADLAFWMSRRVR